MERSHITMARVIVAVSRAMLIAGFLLGWALASGRLAPHQFLSDPAEVVRAFADMVSSGALWPNLSQTAIEVVGGYIFGALAAVALGTVLAAAEPVHAVLRPFLVTLYAIPKITLAPLIVMWFGLGTNPKVILAGVFVFFVVFMNMMVGVVSVSPDLVNVVKVMNTDRLTLLRKITLPSSMPYVFTGLRLAVPESLLGAVVGEFISANSGVGYLANAAMEQLNTAATFAAIAALLFIVAAMDAGLTLAERRMLRWRPREDSAQVLA
jgi:NitT/TauT family transport system permease protein